MATQTELKRYALLKDDEVIGEYIDLETALVNINGDKDIKIWDRDTDAVFVKKGD